MSRHERELFEIAAYRVDQEQWSSDVDARVARYVEGLLSAYDKPSREDMEWARAVASKIEAPFGWQYNEVVGWVRLLWDGPGPAIKGYLWMVDRERFRRGFTPHPFGFQGKVIEVWGSRYERSAASIFARLRKQLTGLTSAHGALRGRFLDLRVFDAIGPHVDWPALIQRSDDNSGATGAP